ncbi:phage tail protein [bacterium]|nr:phage tail protein [bacterium]
MAQAYIGEIRIMAFPFAPKNWALCNGQILPISQNQALFAVLGTTYGGNGTTTFALPNLQGRAPIHWGNGNGLPPAALGQTGGEEAHALTGPETATHNHLLKAAAAPAANAVGPGNNFLGAGSQNQYVAGSPVTALAAETIQPPTASGQPHANMQPYQVLNICICLVGVFPSRT